MNSQREAFEKEFPLSEDTRWSDERGIYVIKDYDGKYPDPGQNMLYVAWQKGSEWQAATEQGVGKDGYSVEADLYETQKALSAAEAKIEEYEGFFTGEDGDDHGGDAKAIINDYLRTHPPKPTGGGVPEGWTQRHTEFLKTVLNNPGCKLDNGEAVIWVDDGSEYGSSIYLWDLPERLGLITSVGSYKWVPSGRISLSVAIDGVLLLATQQPPEQE